jgi:hypothetical protein
MTNWEAIFTQSPVNQGYYNEQRLPQQHWAWPHGTWFQSRLDLIRDHASGGALKTSRKFKETETLRDM